MEGEGEGIRLSKRFSDKGGEVDLKTKAGTAWSHSYLNQKPWHPLSYPNQRRKWIAEQTHAQRLRRTEDVAREYAQEQEFFRQTALISKKEKEKIETMKAVSFMYVRPPGYNAESAKAAEIADENKRQEQNNTSDYQSMEGTSTAVSPGLQHTSVLMTEGKKKPRPKDVFGRPLPTEEEFEILKNAPRLETGVPARVKPFGVEVRNVKCLRCGNYGHQSGDRECPLKDAIMPNEESRLRRDDPLTAIMAHTDPSEPLKWELKQKPGMSPPRGGFNIDDPNQQIVSEDIFDEYGGFLSGGNIPELLTNFSSKPKKRKSTKKHKHKKQSSTRSRESRAPEEYESSPPCSEDEGSSKRKRKHKKKNQNRCCSSSSIDSDFTGHQRSSKHKHSYSSGYSDSDQPHRNPKGIKKHHHSSEDSDAGGECRNKKHWYFPEDGTNGYHRKGKGKRSYLSADFDNGRHSKEKSKGKDSNILKDLDADRNVRNKKHQEKRYSSDDNSDAYYKRDNRQRRWHYLLDDNSNGCHKSGKKRHRRHCSSDDNSDGRQENGKRQSQKHYSSDDNADGHHKGETRQQRKHHSSDDDSDGHQKSGKSQHRHSYLGCDNADHRSKHSRHHHGHNRKMG